MKKLFAISLFLLLSCVIFAQDRTVSKSMLEGFTYYQYTGVTADTLTANQDTIDFVLKYSADGYVRKISVKTRFDLVSGNDTTISTSVFGKEFSDDATYVQIIAAATSDDVNADNTIQILTSDWTETVAQYNSTVATYNSTIPATDIPFTNPTAGTADTLEVPQIVVANAAQTITNAAQTVTPLDKSYRYYRVRYIYPGASAAGSGVKIDEIELKLYTD